MRRNSTQLELVTPGATTWLPWISDPGSNRVDGYPNFDGFTGPSRTIRETAWQDFLDSGEELEIIPDPEPPPPDPDWTTFNLTLIPPAPGSQTTFEAWLEQFKIQHQAPLASAAGLGNLGETQRLYDSFKTISQDESTPQTPPTPEQVAEWQAIADACHVPIRF